jgi:hypothetical protein
VDRLLDGGLDLPGIGRQSQDHLRRALRYLERLSEPGFDSGVLGWLALDSIRGILLSWLCHESRELRDARHVHVFSIAAVYSPRRAARLHLAR